LNVLSHPGLHCRDFGSSLLSVSDLKDWLSANRLRVATLPSIDEYDFVQIESLLCAVERAASAATSEDEAEKIVSADPFLAEDEAADFAPRWLFAAEAHRKWRIKITHAIMNGQLCVLDFASKLPVKIPDAAVRSAAQFGPTADELAAGIYAPAKRDETDNDSHFGLGAADPLKFAAAQGALDPWMRQDPRDRGLVAFSPWGTSARYFARTIVKDDPGMLTKRDALAKKVRASLDAVGIKKRGGRESLDPVTIKKAFSNLDFS
jgi:hypothetical protein